MPRTLSREIHNGMNIIDSRDVIARITYLENNLNAEYQDWLTTDRDIDAPLENQSFSAWLTEQAEDGNGQAEELIALQGLANDGEQLADWTHGVTLIRDSYFEDYARELACDIGAIDEGVITKWPYSHIDWTEAAHDLKGDYRRFSFSGEDYWVTQS